MANFLTVIFANLKKKNHNLQQPSQTHGLVQIFKKIFNSYSLLLSAISTMIFLWTDIKEWEFTQDQAVAVLWIF